MKNLIDRTSLLYIAAMDAMAVSMECNRPYIKGGGYKSYQKTTLTKKQAQNRKNAKHAKASRKKNRK